MIPDKIFKNLNHSFDGFQKLSNGQFLESGYKPDYVLKKGNDFIILESENCSSRKTYVGGLIKAAHYLQNEKTGKLIFVIEPKKNTKVVSIARHLKKYLDWLGKMTNLNDVYVIEANKYYCESKGVLCSLDSETFYSFAHKV